MDWAGAFDTVAPGALVKALQKLTTLRFAPVRGCWHAGASSSSGHGSRCCKRPSGPKDASCRSSGLPIRLFEGLPLTTEGASNSSCMVLRPPGRHCVVMPRSPPLAPELVSPVPGRPIGIAPCWRSHADARSRASRSCAEGGHNDCASLQSRSAAAGTRTPCGSSSASFACAAGARLPPCVPQRRRAGHGGGAVFSLPQSSEQSAVLLRGPCPACQQMGMTSLCSNSRIRRLPVGCLRESDR